MFSSPSQNVDPDLPDRESQWDQRRKIIASLCVVMREDVRVHHSPQRIHQLLRGDLGNDPNGDPLVLHDSEVWEIVEYAFRGSAGT